MRKIVPTIVIFASGVLAGLALRSGPALAGGGGAAANGDVNGDGSIDLSDAVSLLDWLFLGGADPVPIDCPGSSPRLPATGLASCFDAAGEPTPCTGGQCSGQDGFYRTGCPIDGRFTDHGDGTVTDQCTGLTWEKDSSSQKYLWCEALQYCESLGLGGHSDWRLPNARELLSLVHYGRSDPAIDPVFRAVPSGHWTSTSSSLVPDASWCVVFGLGTSEIVGKDARLNVRAVRGGN